MGDLLKNKIFIRTTVVIVVVGFTIGCAIGYSRISNAEPTKSNANPAYELLQDMLEKSKGIENSVKE